MAKYSHYRYDREYKDVSEDVLYGLEFEVARGVASSYRITFNRLGYMNE